MITDGHEAELKEIFIKHGVVLAYLFGSQAAGRITPLSDVDLAVLFPTSVAPQERFRRQLDLIGDCGHLFGRNDVDVVVLNEAPPLLAFEVVSKGKRLYEDPAARPAAAFRLYAFNRYVDTAPLRRLRHRNLLKRLDQFHPATTPNRGKL
jgi:hypothetical protein